MANIICQEGFHGEIDDNLAAYLFVSQESNKVDRLGYAESATSLPTYNQLYSNFPATNIYEFYLCEIRFFIIKIIFLKGTNGASY